MLKWLNQKSVITSCNCRSESTARITFAGIESLKVNKGPVLGSAPMVQELALSKHVRAGEPATLTGRLVDADPADVLTLTPEELAADLHLGAGGLLVALQAARPYMSAGARVTATGSMAADQPDPAAPSLGVQKAALRNLVRSIDATLKGDGIRAVSLTVRGALSREGAFTADRVAEAIYAAATQPEDDWQTEVPYAG